MILDLITAILVVYGFYQGFSSGLIKTVFATLSLIVAIVAALKLSPILIETLQSSLSINPAITFVLGFVLTFILFVIVIRFIGKKLEGLMESLHIGGVNKLLGGLVMGFFFALLISIAVHFMNKIELISDKQKEASFTYPLLEPLPRMSQGVGQQLKPVFSEFWDKMIDTMDAVKAKSEE